MRTITSAINGQTIPVTSSLNVTPLFHTDYNKNGDLQRMPVKNGHGRTIMNDEWIYVVCPGYGNISINVNRANYCQKIYLQNTRIADSFSGRATKRLQRFIDTVGSTLVFEKGGVSYRVFLRKRNGWFDVARVVRYWQAAGTGGVAPSWSAIEKKYGTAVADKMAVDLSIFDFE